tara:strand:+ start:214 stop:381 length:168 start_codon:yes stop_codon:yes gene_type:complete
MSDTNKWIESARVSLDELEKEVKRLREGIKGLSEDWLRWDERGIKMAKTLMELIE